MLSNLGKKRNVFAKNLLIDIELSKAQIPKIIQSSGRWLNRLGKKVIKDLAFPLLEISCLN